MKTVAVKIVGTLRSENPFFIYKVTHSPKGFSRGANCGKCEGLSRVTGLVGLCGGNVLKRQNPVHLKAFAV